MPKPPRQFQPTEIFIHGPNVPSFVKTVAGMSLIVKPGPKPIVIMRGPAPFFADISFREQDEDGLKVTGGRFGRHVAFEFCGGSMVDDAVEAASTSSDLAVIGEAVKPFLKFMSGTFMIG